MLRIASLGMTVGINDAWHPFRLSHPQAAPSASLRTGLEAATQQLGMTIGIEREPPAEG